MKLWCLLIRPGYTKGARGVRLGPLARFGRSFNPEHLTGGSSMYPTTEISRRRSPRPFPGRGSRPLSGLHHHAEGLDVGEPRRAIPQSEEGTLGPYARTTAVRTPLAARRPLPHALFCVSTAFCRCLCLPLLPAACRVPAASRRGAASLQDHQSRNTGVVKA